MVWAELRPSQGNLSQLLPLQDFDDILLLTSLDGSMPVSRTDVADLEKTIGVQLVRFLYCDYAGVTRGKALHVAQLADKLREGTGLTRAMMAMNLLDQLQYIEGMKPVGEIRLLPDPATFTVLPWTPGSANVLCDQLDHNHKSWGACPRLFLKDTVARPTPGHRRGSRLRERILPGLRAGRGIRSF